MTQYNPIFRSPITQERNIENRKSKIENRKSTDLTGVQITLIRGDASETLQLLLPVNIPANPGDLVDLGAGLLGRLTPAEFYLFGKIEGAKLPSAAALDTQNAKSSDLTHNKAALKLSGSAAPETLSNICGLDFHDSEFPNLRVKQSSAAKVKILIARCDEDDVPTYYLHIARPFGQYFWETMGIGE